MPRSADELINTSDPAWPALQQMIDGAGPAVRLLPADEKAGRREIESLQVTTKSLLGATAFHTGGLLVDSGWLRVLGCGHAECTWSITEATRHAGFWQDFAPPQGLIVAVDVLGGLFAINGGCVVDVPLGNVCYFGPDTLRWDDTSDGHSAWLAAMLDASHREKFYADLRWNGWEREVAALRPNMGFAVWPPLFTRESRPIEGTSRAAVPVAEVVALAFDFSRQMEQPG